MEVWHMGTDRNRQGQAGGHLAEAREFVEGIERGLATLERDEVIVERVGAVVLFSVLVLLGGAAAVAVALFLVRRRISEQDPAPPAHPNASDSGGEEPNPPGDEAGTESLTATGGEVPIEGRRDV
jgi:hypothetical protein